MRTISALIGVICLLPSFSTLFAEDLQVQPIQTLDADESPYNVYLVDLDGDDDLDILVGNYGGGSIGVSLNNDGIPDCIDDCTDTDGDSFGNPGFPLNTCPVDNCPDIYNPDQADTNSNGIGDVCESCCGRYTGGYPGNTNCGTDGHRNLADITRLIDRLYISKVPLCCEANGNANADIDGKISLSDITKLIDLVYISKWELPHCL